MHRVLANSRQLQSVRNSKGEETCARLRGADDVPALGHMWLIPVVEACWQEHLEKT